MSMRTNLGGAVLAATLMMGLSGGAQAIPPGSTAPTCADVLTTVACYEPELRELCEAIEDSGAPLKQRDKDTMISKVVGASIKIDQEKPLRAAEKLDDIQSKLDALTGAAKTKIAEADADAIQSKLNAATLCVDGL